MTQLTPKTIHSWSDKRRWGYSGERYLSLEGIAIGDKDGTLTFLFSLSFVDRIKLLFGRGIYVSVMAFGRPLQPLRVDTQEPEFVEEFRKYHDATDEACT